MESQITTTGIGLNVLSPVRGSVYVNLPVPSDPPTIRLLDLEAPLHNKSGSIIDTPLAGRLRTVKLHDSPSFTALSYVWGDGTKPPKQIVCGPDGATLDITENCHAALEQIRKRYGAISIWVDSICINQQDEAEKVSQIPLMGDIYTWATVVYVWLGEETESSNRAMKLLNHLGNLAPPIPVSVLAARTEGARELQESRLWTQNFWNAARK